MTSQSSLTRVRLNGLDHLRFLVIVGVVVLHASMTFMAYAPEWWYVVDPPGSLAYTLLVLAIDVPIMPILFFLSGYFAWASLVRRGPGPFLRGKALRIGAPWVIGSLLLAPPTAYLALASRGLGDGLVAFWSGPFWGPWYQQSVYWFLGVLFLLFVLTSLVARVPGVWAWLERDVDACSHESRRRRYARLGGFWLIPALLFFLVHRSVPLDAWRNWGYILVVQPNRIGLYVAYYVLGLGAGRGRWLHREWLRDERAWPGLPTWSLLAVVAMLGYLANRVVIPAAARDDVVVQAVTALLFSGTVFTWLMLSLAFARVFLEQWGPRLRRLSSASYWIYFFHPVVLYPTLMGLRALPWLPRIVAWLIGIAVSVAVPWLIAEAVAAVRHRVGRPA